MNNDRFKFRVWDAENKEYVSAWVFVNRHGEVCTIKTGCFYKNKTTIEQCTGLRDKNGKLIYEGDILGNGNGPLRIVVVWENVYWGYYADGSFHALPFWVNKLEIIGNIHEEAKDE